jgi:hypothetical protein
VREFSVAPDFTDQLEGWLEEAREQAGKWVGVAQGRATLYAKTLELSDRLGRSVTVEDLFGDCEDEAKRAELLALINQAVVDEELTDGTF